MKTNYIIEIEKGIEIRTHGGYLSQSEIEEQIALQKYGEFFEEIARVEALEEAREIFNANKEKCTSKQRGRKIETDELRIREINFDDEGEELEPDGMEIIDSYVAMLDGYVVSENGKAVDFELAETYMDDEIREELDAQPALCEDQEFFTEYEKKHYEKFGESFAKVNGIEC